MTAGLKRQLEQLATVVGGREEALKRRAAIGSWAAMLGALILARMSDDNELSNEVPAETLVWLAEQNQAE